MALPTLESVRFDSVEPATGITEPEEIEVRRWDAAELAKAEITPDGFLRAPATIARSGIHEYRQPNGNVIRELRPPEVVFAPDAIRSFSHLPLTNDHPPEMLNAKTARKHQIGSAANARREQDHLVADILITDEQAIADAKRGKTSLSAGYIASVAQVGGVWKDDKGVEHRFDQVQTKIRGNHVSQCWRGVAGTTRFRMDSADGLDVALPLPTEDPKMSTKKITIGTTEFEVPAAAAEAFTARLDALVAQVASLEAKRNDSADLAGKDRQIEELKGRLTAAEAELKARMDSEERSKKSAAEQAKFIEQAELYALASPILGKPIAELAKMDSLDVMKQCVQKESPKLSIEGASPDFIRGIFKHVTANRVDSAAALNRILGDASEGAKVAQHNVDKTSAAQKRDEARQKMLEDQRSAWKQQQAR